MVTFPRAKITFLLKLFTNVVISVDYLVGHKCVGPKVATE